MCIPVSPPLSGNWSNHRFASTHECRPPYPPRHQHGPATGKSTLVPQVCSWPRRSRSECCVTKPSTDCISELRTSARQQTHRTEAERLAANAESGFSFPFPLAPAPALLAFPPQPHAPWDQVWIGDREIIGEVTEGGVAARIILSYADIRIITAPESQTYHCGKHDPAPIPTLVSRMRKAAKQAAALNSKIPEKNYPLKTAVIAILPRCDTMPFATPGARACSW